jgi:uncharacterized membrane protein/protein-disulfide isomerase
VPKSKPNKKTSEKNSSRTGIVLVRFFFFISLGISIFLAWRAMSGGGVPGCGPDSDCDRVLGSRWAYLFGLPVSALAILVYVAAIAITFQRQIPWKGLLGIAVTVIGAALWFVGLQVFAIKAFCKFCMVAHVAGAIAAVLVLKKVPLPRGSWKGPMLAGLAAAALLIVAQVASPAPAPIQVSTGFEPVRSTNGTVQTALTPSSTTTNTATQNGIAPNAPTFSIVRGRFTLDLTKVPVSGSLNAPKKVVKLFDYTCHHCRDLHHLLHVAKEKHATELAVISLPMPLDGSCNPTVRKTPSAHVNACEYAKLSLAVFYAEPKKFEAYSDWLFAPQRPPELIQAREQAASLIGKERLLALLADPRIDAQIRQDVEIYAASSQLGKSSAMPQLIFQGGASIGSVNNFKELEQILFDALGLR